MRNIQFIQTSPEELTLEIVNGLKKEIDQLKRDFQPKQPTEYLTRSEISKILKVDLSTIHNWTKQGKLKPYGIGSRIYFKRDEVEQSLIELRK